MSDIRINQTSNTVSLTKPSKRRAKKKTSSVPRDEFQYTSGNNEQLDKDAIKKFFDDSKNAREAMKTYSHYKPVPKLNETAAGWQMSMMSRGGTNCFMKVPLSDKSKMLVIPLENWGGGSFSKPAVIDLEKGITGIPDIHFSGNTQATRYAQSADKKELFIINGTTPMIDSYDENLNKTGTIDLSKVDKDLEHINAFTPAGSGNYVFAVKKNFGPGMFIALDPKTGKVLWQKDYKNTFIREIVEGPDKNIYLTLGNSMDSKSSIDVYRPDGKLLKKYTGFKDPGKLTFTPDGNALVTDNRHLKKLKFKEDEGTFGKSIQPEELWSVKGDFRRFHITPDGKFVFAADTKSGFARSHGIMKIDLNTGKVEWNREKYGENYIDHKVVGDEICLMTSSDDRKTTRMVRLDMAGNEIWESTHDGVIDEYEIGKEDAVTDDGHFLAGGREDGNFTCLRPRQQGEDENSIKSRISINEKLMGEAQKSVNNENSRTGSDEAKPEQGLEIHDNFVIIGGVKLEKKKQ